MAFLGILLSNYEQGVDVENQAVIGMFAALGSALIYAISIVLFKSESQKYSSFETVFFQNAVGAIIFLPFFLMMDTVPSSRDYLISISYTVVMGVGVFNLFFYGLKRLPASTTSMIMYVEFASAILLSVIWLKENISIMEFLGIVLIISATFFIRKSKS